MLIKRLSLVAFVVLSLTGCNKWRELVEGKPYTPAPLPPPTYQITGTWKGFYSTNLFSGEEAVMWINPMKLGDPSFVGVFNGGHYGGMDGVSTSNVTGSMSGKTFALHISAPATVDPLYCVHNPTNAQCLVGINPTETTNCPGEFDVTGQYETDQNGNGSGLSFTSITGSNCLGTTTSGNGHFGG
jgi:hypothetical protein